MNKVLCDCSSLSFWMQGFDFSQQKSYNVSLVPIPANMPEGVVALLVKVLVFKVQPFEKGVMV